MILRVLYPHTDEQGQRFGAGDLREVPDELVEQFLAVSPIYRTALLGLDESFDQAHAKTRLPVFEPPPVDEDEAALLARIEAQAKQELEANQALLSTARANAEAAAAAEAAAIAQRQSDLVAQEAAAAAEATKAAKTAKK
jgi:hypothetical protein